jgi:hypothetical protein
MMPLIVINRRDSEINDEFVARVHHLAGILEDVLSGRSNRSSAEAPGTPPIYNEVSFDSSLRQRIHLSIFKQHSNGSDQIKIDTDDLLNYYLKLNELLETKGDILKDMEVEIDGSQTTRTAIGLVEEIKTLLDEVADYLDTKTDLSGRFSDRLHSVFGDALRPAVAPSPITVSG